ncbi:MAG: right-handed parallel beta-helix repeat-containing protein [Verrucomicrobiales bacterium]|nr:right-handed parallel beta-helix repeat-containing protein [Verrucomicrobiales bacterium]
MRWFLMALGILTVSGAALGAARGVVVVDRDDVVIRESCTVVIPPGLVIADPNTNGVIQIRGDGLTLRFASGSVLRGAREGAPGDELRGIGITVMDSRRVRVLGARVHGYFNGLVASRADQLTVEGGDYSDNYRQRLRSTPEAEDGADWLYPHRNDEVKWRDQYGGAVCVEHSRRVTIRGVRVRRGQNGIVLDRVNESRIYDNDASFLSGWGLAMWRSSRNLVSRNAFDFCVRGHVEGVYNRGQDSAGILCFEQCNGNQFVENSATHGGDGFFGFAGREAIGEDWMESERARLRRETGKQEVDDLIQVPAELARTWSERGCNSNVLVGNDFSYAPAHGFEMTFSEGNVFIGNRVVENAICGIWGGYSSGMWVANNEFTRNGGMAYGLERGAINMEHASGNRIVGNRFVDNRCGIHLWWDNDAALLRFPGVSGNARGVRDNVILGNQFEISAEPGLTSRSDRDRWVVLQLRDDGTGHVQDNHYVSNRVSLGHARAVEFDFAPGCSVSTSAVPVEVGRLRTRAVGSTRPVGARAALRGRHQIIMDEWGPWDHEAPVLRARSTRGGERVWDLLGVTTEPRLEVEAPGVKSTVERTGESAWRLTLRSDQGVTPFRATVSAPGLVRHAEGTLVSARWSVVFFPWTVDPRQNLDGWRRQAEGAAAVRTELEALTLPYGGGGPRDVVTNAEVKARGPGPDHFGMRAQTRLKLPKGSWGFRTQSDDGVRVRVGNRVVIENWTWHGPTLDEGRYEQLADGEVEIEVEHFEIDGFAVFELSLERVGE